MNASTEFLPQQDNPRVFIVDDDPYILGLLESMLTMYGYTVFLFVKASEALQSAQNELPDLILLDIAMPEMDGFEACERLKQIPDLKDIPVVFMSGMNSVEDIIKGYQVGGVDYITKPFHPEEVQARVKTHINLSVLRNKLEYQKLVEKKVREVSEAQQATNFCAGKTGRAEER